jgi:pimeloyl-ACP methyl ester carboxylesterase
VRYFLAVALLFAALAASMIFSQDDIIFPVHAVAAAGPLPPDAERLQVETPDGDTLHGVHIPPAQPTNGPKTLILGFGGNAWNGEDVASYLHELFPGADVVAFHYRGYRPSTGSPSADALLEDAPLAHDAAIAQVRPERTVAIGFSIGSGVAASLANRREIDGLILLTPFDSLKKVASDAYPWLPVGPFFRHEIDTVAALRGSTVPVAVIAAGRDEIIPPARTEALRGHVSNLVFDRTIAGAGHNDIYQRDAFHQAIKQALDEVSQQ